jgi:hypothetical protein
VLLVRTRLLQYDDCTRPKIQVAVLYFLGLSPCNMDEEVVVLETFGALGGERFVNTVTTEDAHIPEIYSTSFP